MTELKTEEWPALPKSVNSEVKVFQDIRGIPARKDSGPFRREDPPNLLCWSYHPGTKILVAGCTNNTVHITSTVEARLFDTIKLGDEKDDTNNDINLDFDVFSITNTKVRCVIGNQKAKVYCLDIETKDGILHTEVSHYIKINKVLTRSILTEKYIILVSDDVLVYSPTWKIIYKFDCGAMGFNEIPRGGELLGEVLFLSSKGQLVALDMDEKTQGRIQDTHADNLKIWKDMFVYTNDLKCTIFILGGKGRPNAVYNVEKNTPIRMKINSDYFIFISGPSIVTFVKLVNGKLVKTDKKVISSVTPLVCDGKIFSFQSGKNSSRIMKQKL
jgi:hypothetical protein